MVGWAMARRLRISATACASERSLFRNFSRAGVAANRSVTSIRVPGGAEAGRTGPFTPASTTMADPVAASAVAGGDRQPRHRADRGQRLAAKAERRDGEQVAVRELRGGMPLDRELQILRGSSRAVVDDADQPAAARLDRDLDGARRRHRSRSRPAPSRPPPDARPPRPQRCGRRGWDRGGGRGSWSHRLAGIARTRRNCARIPSNVGRMPEQGNAARRSVPGFQTLAVGSNARKAPIGLPPDTAWPGSCPPRPPADRTGRPRARSRRGSFPA